MATEIILVSGFLGAGKTTLVQKLLKEAFAGQRIALIENDFGEISIDAALLQTSGFQVREINSGCICCSLSGDFVKALKELLDACHPDRILIEPSGVGKLSDIIQACADARLRGLVRISRKITVVDVKRSAMYLENFGEFFEDQIRHTDAVVFSRVEAYPDRIEAACRLVRGINASVAVFCRPWDTVDTAELLHPEAVAREHAHHGHGCGCHDHEHHEHEQHDHDPGHCEHDHSAEDVFDTLTIRTDRRFTQRGLRERIARLERGAPGVLRAKGILRGVTGSLNVQYVPGDLKITGCDLAGNTLNIIGKDLDKPALARLFDGE